MAKQLNQSATVNMVFTADASQAKAQIASLQKDLSNLMSGAYANKGFGTTISSSVSDISKLKTILSSSVNEFGKLDLSAFQKNLNRSNMTLASLATSIGSLGAGGQAAFSKLTNSILQAEIPIKRTSKLVDEMKTTLLNSARWTIASSAIKALETGISGAYSYAQNLNKSLTDIRIVSEKSADEMARFAIEANKAAKNLNTTTKNYSDASLIYFQQGLADDAVKQRTDITVKMANVAGESAEKVSSQLTAVWNNFDDGSKSLEYFADVMVKLGAYTASSTDEISAGLQKFAPIAKTVGLSYEYAASAIATITATTRESADTVGTALKTIFSRIQGLSLGETLEDGTDLNKYSRALKTVGIDIKDTSGNLKDMDVILDELGSKWDTLTRAEKMATAETVGGARQYTQLMNLMENWDYFQELVGVSKNSSGTLNEQAEIYAESWEAASKKVKASLEGLYNNLVNENFWIGATKGLSWIIDRIDALTVGLGGLPGLLSIVANKLVVAFGPEMAKSIDATFSNFINSGEIGKGFQKSIRQNTINQLLNMSTSSIYSGGATSNTAKLGYTNQANIQQRIMNSSDDWDEFQRKQAGAILDRQTAATDAAMAKAQIKDEADLDFTRFNRTTIKGMRKNNPNANFMPAWSLMERTYNGNEAASIADTFWNEAQKFSKGSTDSSGFLQNTDNIKNYLNDFQEAFHQMDGKILTPETKAELNDLTNLLNTLSKQSQFTAKDMQSVSSAIENLQGTIDIDKALKEYRSALDKTKWSDETKDAKIKAAEQAFSDQEGNVKAQMETFREMMAEIRQGEKDINNLPTQQVTPGQALSSLTQSLTGAAQAAFSFKGIWDALNNEDFTFWDKLLATSGGIANGLEGITNFVANGKDFVNQWKTFSGLKDSIEFLGQFKNEANKMGQIIGLAQSAESVADLENKLSALVGTTDASAMASTLFANRTNLETAALIANGKAALFAKAAKLGLIAIAAVALAFVANEAIKASNSLQTAVNNTAQATENLKSKAQETKTEYDNIKSAFDKYDSIVEKLNSCTKGTETWKEALEEVNQEILSILQNYPELAGKLNIERNSETGQLQILNEDEILNELEQKSNFSDASALLSSINSNNLAIQQTRRNYTDDLVSGLTYYSNILDDVLKNPQKYADYTQEELLSDMNSRTFTGKDIFGDKIADIYNAVQDLANRERENSIANENIAKTIIDSELKDNYNSQVKELITDNFQEDYASIYDEVLTQAKSYSQIAFTDKLQTDSNSIWHQWLQAKFGANEGNGQYTLDNNAIRGDSYNREFYYHEKGNDEIQKVSAEELAADIAAAQALGNLTNNAQAAADALNQIKGTENITSDNAKSYIASGNFEQMAQSELIKLREQYANAKDKTGFVENLFGGEENLEVIAKLQGITVKEFISNFNTALADIDFDAVGKNAVSAVQDAFQQVKSWVDADQIPHSATQNLSVSEQEQLITQMNTIYGQLGQEGLNSFVSIIQSLVEAGEEGAPVLKAILGASFGTTDGLWALESVIAQLAAISPNAANALQGIIDALEQIAGKAKTIEDAQTIHSAVEPFLDTKFGDTITEEEYNQLAKVMKKPEDYFMKDANGDYIRTEVDDYDYEEAIANAMNSGFEQIITDREAGVIATENLAENYTLEDLQTSALTAGTENDISSNKIDAQLALARALGYGSDPESSEAATLTSIEDRSIAGELTPDDADILENIISELTNEYENLDDIINTLGEDAETVKDMLAWDEITRDAERYGIALEDVQKLADQMIKDDKFKGNNKRDVQRRALENAEMYLRQKEGLEELTEAQEEYNQAVDSKDIEKQSKAFDQMKTAIEKIFKTKFDKLPDNFKKMAKEGKLAGKTVKELGSILVNELGKKAPKAVQNMDSQLDETFQTKMEEFKNSTDEAAQEIGNNMQDFWNELNDPNFVGEFSNSAQKGFEAWANTILDGAAQAGMSMDQAKALLEAKAAEMGVEMPEYEVEALPVPAETVPGYETISIYGHKPWEVGDQSIKYDTVSEQVPSTTRDAYTTYQLKLKNGDKASKTGSPAPSGGGGGGGGGGQAKTPKAHKKSDMSKRYHRVKEQIDDTDRQKEAAADKKERGYGKEKITQAETEIKLQKQKIELQKEYVEEAAKYLAEDRKTLEDFAASMEDITGMKLEFDDSGVITNFREIEQALLDYENYLIDLENGGMEGPWLELEQRRVDDMREYMERYEETLNLYEEQLQEMFNQADELDQLYLELTDIKVVLKVDVAEDKLTFMEYLLGKIEDNAYKVADAMGYLGQETSAAMDKIIAYRQGIDEIMRRRMDINDDGKLMDAFYNGTITAADLVGLGFTQDDIDKIREYRDSLIEAMETLNEMRTNALDKLVDSFDSFNEQLEGQTATLEHHVSVLEAYKDIVDLIGTHNILQGRQILSQLNNAQFGAVRAQLGESKNVYDTLLAQRDEYKRAMEDAVIAGNEEAARLWQQRLVDINDTVNSAKETYLSNFQDALDTAIDIFSDSVELAAEDFDKLLSPIYNTIDALQNAYDRQETVDNDYVQDYEKYYALQKNLRALDEAIDDTDSIVAKNRLLKIQQEINNYKAEDVKLSQYDLDALEKRIELEKARIALEEGDDAKSTVALTRDSEGNWGYVYTADEEDIRQKEQEYEDKLKEYQDLNKDYINDLQKQILDFEAETRDAIKEVWQDTTLSESEKLTQIQQIYETAQQHMADLNQQMNNALANQAGTYELAIDRYKTSNLELIDSFEETRLSMLTGFKTTDEVMNSFNTALESYIVQLRKLQEEYEQNVDDIKNEADIQDWAKTITDEINRIGVESEEASTNINKLSKDMDEAFKSGVKAAEDFEKQYGEMIDHMVSENERFIASLTNMIALLSKLNTANPEFKDLQSEYDAQTSKLRDGEISAAEWDTWYKDWSKRMDKWLETFDTTGSYTETDDIALKDQNGSVTPEAATLSAEDRAMLNTVVTNGTVMMAQGVGALDAAAAITQGNETVVQQTVSITAEFPNVSDSNEITEALNNIINDASQYANRKDENF